MKTNKINCASGGVKLFITAALSIVTSATALAQTASQNYIRERIPRRPIKTESKVSTLTSNKDSVQTTIAYLDGLGRPLQTIQRQASPLGKDVVQVFAYDAYDREVTKYLPFVATTTSGNMQSSAISKQSTFYTSPPTGVAANANPYSQTSLEASPLNRPLEQGAPGAAWQLGSGHTVKMSYKLNNNIAFTTDSVNSRQVALYKVTINSDGSRVLARTSNATYASNQLTVTITKDENWVSGRAGTVEEYKDKDGRVILKRTYNYKNGTLEPMSTYYVYDEMGNLCYVLPPGTDPDTAVITTQTIIDLCYEYWYDERLRLFRKKLPGKAWEFLVYNRLDQVVYTQDGNQRNKAPQQWTFNKYDTQGRVALTGLYAYGSTANSSPYTPSASYFNALQNKLDTTSAPLWETRDNNAAPGYTSIALPLTYTQAYTINYYDDYSAPAAISPVAYTAPANATLAVRGLPTYQYTNILGTTNMLAAKMFYDADGRVVKSYKQHYLGGTFNYGNYDATSSTYDFIGAMTTSSRQHFTTASTTTPKVTIANRYIYDHMGRKLKTWQQITNAALAADTRTLLSETDYNEIGQVYTKSLHSTDSTTFKQVVTYSYNERGWLSKADAPLFEEQLLYNLGTNKQYNGNIMYQQWGTSAVPNSNTFTYLYDKINRLTKGTSSDDYREQNIAYDKQGNITGLRRYWANTAIDRLAYVYNSTNQLQSITDSTTSDQGLKHGTWAYTYDLNGNLMADPSKGITNISYNYLNLPEVFTGKSTTYTYDATGQKLRRVVSTTATDYISGIQYDGTSTPAISFIQTEEGRALPNGATAYNYEYSLTDHLGNSRVNFDTGTGIARQVQKDDYMPFGMEINRSVVLPKNEYLYNKKELQENLGVYDYGARFYDPVIARWTSVDPLAEKYNKWSPYNYVQNNPIRMIDPDGMGHFDTNGNWVADATDNDTYAYRAQVTTNNQTFTWMGKDAGWVAENQQSNSALASMYHGYADNGQDPFQGAYGNQMGQWAQSSAGLRDGIERNQSGLDMAEGVATGATMVMGPSAGAAAGEGFISKMVSKLLGSGSAEVEAAAGVQINRAAGNAFRDELANGLVVEGRQVATEVYKRTPFGARYIDIEVSQGGKVLGGIETKVGTSRYTPLQRLKDIWLDLNTPGGYPVNLVRKPPL